MDNVVNMTQQKHDNGRRNKPSNKDNSSKPRISQHILQSHVSNPVESETAYNKNIMNTESKPKIKHSNPQQLARAISLKKYDGKIYAGMGNGYIFADPSFGIMEPETTTVPEFPSLIILPLFMTATLLAVIVYKRNHQTRNKKREA
jgi:hypothetical protein